MTTDNKNRGCEASGCATQRRPNERDEEFLDRQKLTSRMEKIEHKIMVLSGKGGVGKSTVAVNLAVSLAMAGKRVGLLDVDIHGPSVPKLLDVEGRPISGSDSTLFPVEIPCGDGALFVMSIGFLLRERDDAVIWRGPRKFGLIKQFLKDVDWGALDYLVVDSPPGTGDEPLAIAQLIEHADGAVIVTTPQEVAVQDVRRGITFCREVSLPVLGVVENMSGFTCPSCGEVVRIFGTDGGRSMAEQMNVPFMGSIPIEPEIVASGDRGTPIVQAHPHSETAKVFGQIVRKLLEPELALKTTPDPSSLYGRATKIAVPVTEGALSSHFGHCEHFAIFDVDSDGKTIHGCTNLTPPNHEPGVFPRWLHEQGANLIIAGGMGSRALSLFAQNDIEVVVGATVGEPESVVREYLDGNLEEGANVCDH